jgi:hypothetical protein
MMRFSNWAKFDQRDELRNTNYPGVYAIAISTKGYCWHTIRVDKEDFF